MFSSDFSRSPKKRVFQNALKTKRFPKCSQKCDVFQQFFASPKKTCFPKKAKRFLQNVLKNAMFSSNFSRFQQNRAFQNALKISKSAQKCLVFQRFFALSKKNEIPTRSENATSFSTCSQKCDVFQQFFAFPAKSCLPKRSENFKVSPKMPCFPAIFRALKKKRVFQNALKTKRFVSRHVILV